MTSIALSFAVAGCTVRLNTGSGAGLKGSGKLVTNKFEVSDFTEIETGQAFHLDIVRADAFSVIVTTDDNVMKHVTVEKAGAKLKIRLTTGASPTRLAAVVTLPALKGLDLSGAAHATLKGFRSDHPLRLNASGASHVQGDISAGTVAVEASGASQVTLTGSGQTGTLAAGGASHLHFGDFALGRADVSLSGASSAEVKPARQLGYRLSGASHLVYHGHPAVTRNDISGASSASRR